MAGRARVLKGGLAASDLEGMKRELTCPVCQADLMLSGDEPAGEEIFCTFCSAPCRLTAPAASDDCEAEEDF